MFSVKGWAVDAQALKPQTEPVKPPKVGTGANSEQVQGKKRKRNDGIDVAGADVGQLWDRHIEGKVPPKPAKKDKKRDKKQKIEQDGAADEGESKDTSTKIPTQTDIRSKNAVVEPVSAVESQSKGSKQKEKKNKSDKRHIEPDADVKAVTTTKSNGQRKETKASNLTPMQEAMRQKLVSARFRHLNQTLYTEPSPNAFELFDQNPDMFEDYHAGFRQQVSVWPENPLDTFIAAIRARGKARLVSQKKAFKSKKKQSEPEDASTANGQFTTALPRTKGTCIIADLGCGDARLARTLKEANELQNLNLKVTSYDLHSPSSLVTKADISHLPSPDGSVDVAIFCLALMGTNWISFIEEAYRILHWKGELWIAEIKSRFGRVGRAGRPVEHSVGGKRKQAALKKAQEAKKKEDQEVNEQDALAVEVDGVETKNEETDVSAFVDVLKRRGFVLKNGDSSIDLGNKMFVRMEFLKAAAPSKGKGFKDDAQPAARSRPKMKFLDEKADDIATDDEAKVLKPCLYKIR